MISNYRKVLKEVNYSALSKQYINLLQTKDRLHHEIGVLRSHFDSFRERCGELNNFLKGSVKLIDFDKEKENPEQPENLNDSIISCYNFLRQDYLFQENEDDRDMVGNPIAKIESTINQLHELTGKMQSLMKEMRELCEELSICETKLTYIIIEIRSRHDVECFSI